MIRYVRLKVKATKNLFDMEWQNKLQKSPWQVRETAATKRGKKVPDKKVQSQSSPCSLRQGCTCFTSCTHVLLVTEGEMWACSVRYHMTKPSLLHMKAWTTNSCISWQTVMEKRLHCFEQEHFHHSGASEAGLSLKDCWCSICYQLETY